ncbi:unnamed protein product [Rotaria socialis]|uniref:Uncharacterized protein n=1 Tax=Rotaria socialis TaxID=392032 RepID=A0A817NYA0_9BILA|nr:unnamed protein product [Rotaria socialis]CAF3288606.1 unnamed protein product [Rotaria socialis]CAF3464012.1 unnamed protein product [Rotaria socialis]CAF4279293.1 unnamed protein product [Rotaria socialis]CAF4372366.1 unnamed protein product [Rotaria socialis]
MAKVSPNNSVLETQSKNITSTKNEIIQRQSQTSSTELPLTTISKALLPLSAPPAPLSTLAHAVIRIPQESNQCKPAFVSIIESRIKSYKKWFCFTSAVFIILSICFIMGGSAGIFEMHYSDNENSAILIVGSVCLIVVGLIIYPCRFWYKRRSLIQQIKVLNDPLIAWKLDCATWRQYMEYLHCDPRTDHRHFLNVGQRYSCITCKCRTSYIKTINRNGGYLLLYNQCLMIDDFYYREFPVISDPLTIISNMNEPMIVRIPMALAGLYFDFMVPSEMTENNLNYEIDEINIKVRQKKEQAGSSSCCSAENNTDHSENCLTFFADIVSNVVH